MNQRLCLFVILNAGLTASDFSYKDFATLCYPEAPCSPAFAGTLDCCQSFGTDAASQLVLNSAAHFQTCAQINSPTGDVAGLKGRSAVTSSDSQQDPQIWITQLTEVSPTLLFCVIQ
jgi:hypothetical protein